MQKRKKKKPAFHSPAFWLIILLVIGALTAGWWLWHNTYAISHRLNYILITVNGEPQKIVSGEAVSLHPKDKVRVLKISTNIPLNLGVRLAAKGFDVSALQYEEMGLSALLPGQEIFDHYRFRIRVMYRNEELTYMDWDIRPYAEDWLDRADRLIDRAKRLAMLERALGLLPEDRQIRQRLLDEYKSQKLWKQVAGMLEDMAAKEPDQETLIEILDAYTAMQSKDGIISVLNRIVKLDPDDLEARYRLAEVLEGEGKLKAAIREYEAVLKRSGKKGADAESGIRIAALCKHLGYLCTETGYFKKAIHFYLKAVSLDRKDANVYYNLSYLYEKIDQKEKSALYLDKAVRLKSGDVEGRLKLAHGLMEKGDLKKAEKYLEEVLDKKPESLEALLLMAQVMEKQGNKKGLRKIYERILSSEPENETVIYNLGGLLYETGELKESLHYFKRYLILHPEDAAVHTIVFDIYKKGKNTEEALREARTLVELRPNEIGPYRYLFDYWNAKGDNKKIIAIMEKGLKANPEQTELREYLVLAYLKAGKEEPAIDQMAEILKHRPKDVDLLLNLARLREKHGQLEGALDAYRRIIEISSDHEEAEEAYLRLRLKGVRGEGAR